MSFKVLKIKENCNLIKNLNVIKALKQGFTFIYGWLPIFLLSLFEIMDLFFSVENIVVDSWRIIITLLFVIFEFISIDVPLVLPHSYVGVYPIRLDGVIKSLRAIYNLCVQVLLRLIPANLFLAKSNWLKIVTLKSKFSFIVSSSTQGRFMGINISRYILSSSMWRIPTQVIACRILTCLRISAI